MRTDDFNNAVYSVTYFLCNAVWNGGDYSGLEMHNHSGRAITILDSRSRGREFYPEAHWSRGL